MEPFQCACGETEHYGKGLCRVCYLKVWRQTKRPKCACGQTVHSIRKAPKDLKHLCKECYLKVRQCTCTDGYRCKSCRARDRLRRRNEGPQCLCGAPNVARGMCSKCYAKFRKYKLTPEQQQELQAKGCQICGLMCKLDIDHCHTTGKIRGGLCPSCNRFLGTLERPGNWLQKAQDYLARHK